MAPDPYRAFPVQGQRGEQDHAGARCPRAQEQPPCETPIVVPRVGPSMTDEDIKKEWELDYLPTDITRTATRHNL